MQSTLRNAKSMPSIRSRNPLFRRVIVPWYDVELVCYVTIVFVVGIILFSLCGIFEANAIPEYNRYIWIPILLLIMSVVVFISTIMRLVKRKSER